MVCLAVPVFGGRVPIDRSLPKLRQAHDQFDNDNLPGCAVLLREAIRLHLIAVAEFYNVKPDRPQHPANLLAQLAEAKALKSGPVHWFREILFTCRRVLRCADVSAQAMEFCLAFAYENIDANHQHFGERV